MLGLLRHLHRLQIQAFLQADRVSAITFPRVDNTKSKRQGPAPLAI